MREGVVMEGVEVMAEDSEPLDPPIPRSSLIQDVICAILAGKTAKDIHVMHGVDAQALQRLKNSTEFNREMYVARRNVTTAVTEWIKRKTPELAMKMHASPRLVRMHVHSSQQLRICSIGLAWVRHRRSR